jgi:hypothetical protein
VPANWFFIDEKTMVHCLNIGLYLYVMTVESFASFGGFYFPIVK